MFHGRCTYTDSTVCTAAVGYNIVSDRKAGTPKTLEHGDIALEQSE